MCAGRLLTDSLVDGRVVEGLDQRPLLLTGDRVHFEVAAYEELASHVVVGVVVLTGGMCSRLVRRKELKDDGSKDFKWIDCTV